MTIDELSSFVWWMMTHRLEKQSDVDALKAKLWQPPPTLRAPLPPQSPWSPENEMKAFRGLQAQLGLSGAKSPADPLSPGAR